MVCWPEITIPIVKYKRRWIMLWGCFAAEGTGARNRLDGIMRKDYISQDHTSISQEHSVVKAWMQMFFQMVNNLNHTAKVVTKWLKDNKSQCFCSSHQKTLTTILMKIYWQS